MDMERYWDAVNMASGILMIIVNAWMIGLFFRPFLKSGKKIYGIICTYAAVMITLYLIPVNMSGVAAHSIGVIGILAGSLLSDRSNYSQKIFLSATAYLIRWIAGGVILLPWKGLYSITVLNTHAEDGSWLQFGLFIFAELMYVILENILLLLLIKLLHRVYLRKRDDVDRKELLLLLSPYLTIVMGYWFLSFTTNAYEKDLGEYIWNRHGWYVWMDTMFQIAAFLTILATVMSYERIKLSREEELQKRLLNEQVKELKSHVTQVESLYKGIRGMKHDLNNHIQILQELYEKGAYSEAKDYLQDLKQNFSAVEFDVKTGNPVTDIIIMQKQKEAQMHGLSFTQKFLFPDQGSLSAYDISIVLNNVLSNAMEAAAGSREKKVSIQSKMRNDIYFIEVKNSFDGILKIDEESGLPETSRNAEDGHGYGLQNVKKAVERYFGAVNIVQEGNEVRVSLMMVIPA